MLVDGIPYRTVWAEDDVQVVKIIDQRLLPWKFQIVTLKSVDEVAVAICDMWVRGAGCIGATAGFGMWLAAREAIREKDFREALHLRASKLISTRPTAVNLSYAVTRQLKSMEVAENPEEAVAIALQTAQDIADEDATACQAIGKHGLGLIQTISDRKGGATVNILTHCNAGWLAFVDYGSATAPIYAAHRAGLDVHVWVDETRPRNQGARLTAWELAREGVKHTVICDNAGGHLMQHGLVDLVITGADRVTRRGDVANKIGTYLKALSAKDNGVPFYVALPTSTIDWEISDGVKEIPIEQRNADEIRWMEGKNKKGDVTEVALFEQHSPAANYAFDVTPARLITGLITQHGISRTDEQDIRKLNHPSY